MGDGVVDDLPTHAVAEHHERLAATRLLVLMGLGQFVEESLRNGTRLGCVPRVRRYVKTSPRKTLINSLRGFLSSAATTETV